MGKRPELAGRLPAASTVGDLFKREGLVAPVKVPEPVLRKLSVDVAELLAQPDMKTKLESIGMELAPQKGPEFDAFVNREFIRWGKVMKQAGIEPQ